MLVANSTGVVEQALGVQLVGQARVGRRVHVRLDALGGSAPPARRSRRTTAGRWRPAKSGAARARAPRSSRRRPTRPGAACSGRRSPRRRRRRRSPRSRARPARPRRRPASRALHHHRGGLDGRGGGHAGRQPELLDRVARDGRGDQVQARPRSPPAPSRRRSRPTAPLPGSGCAPTASRPRRGAPGGAPGARSRAAARAAGWRRRAWCAACPRAPSGAACRR